MSNKQSRKIAIVGATGNIGSHTVSALLAYGIHQLTAIVRPDSSSKLPEDVKVKRVSFEDENAITRILEGHDVLILQLPVPAMVYAGTFIRAAARAQVPYVLPTEFGSDPAAKLVDEVPMLSAKREPRALIEKLGVSSWVAVITNPWYDLVLRDMGPRFGFDIKNRKATLWDGGMTKMNFSTLYQAGVATAGLVSLPDAELRRYKNQPFYATSFHVTQREILASIMRATKTEEEDWKIEESSIDDIIRTADENAQSEPRAGSKFFALHFKEGYGGDFQEKAEDLKKLFGFEIEDFDTVTAEAVRAVLNS